MTFFTRVLNVHNANLSIRCVALAACMLALGACRSLPTAAPASAISPAAATSAVKALSYAEEPTRSAFKEVLAAGQSVSIQNDFGDVRLRFGGYEHVLEMTAVAQSPIGSAMPVVTFDKLSGQVRTSLPATASGAIASAALGQRIDIVLWIPQTHSVRVSTISGLVEVRGVRDAVVARSTSGAITARGVQGTLDLETGSGSVEIAFDASVKGAQRVVTQTGAIIAAFGASADATLKLATSGLIGTEYSVEITPQPGLEPNKSGLVTLGAGKNSIEIASKRGELRLFRRQDFVQ
jgi:hypothetical protein